MNPKHNKLWKKQKYLVKKYCKEIKLDRVCKDMFVEDDEELKIIGEEIVSIIKNYSQLDKLFFVDICSAPGNYSKLLLDKFENSTGIGISLPIESGGVPFKIKHDKFKIFYKDILEKNYKLDIPKNLNLGIASCVSYTIDSKNAFRLNLQLILKSMLLILENLKEDGAMVINLTIKNIYFAFNIINLLNKLFGSSSIWKSKKIWVGKNTFYFFGFNFKYNQKVIDELYQIKKSLDNKFYYKNKYFNFVDINSENYKTIEKHIENIYKIKINYFESKIN